MEILLREIETPLSVFDIYSLFVDEDIILLDSARDPDGLGRYSFMGINPFKKIVYSQGVIKEDGKPVHGDPFEVLKDRLSKYRVDNDSKLPFIGGAMGYLSYDLGRVLETLPETLPEVVQIPDLYFVFYTNIIIVDHHRHGVYISELCEDGRTPIHLDRLVSVIGKGRMNSVRSLETVDWEMKSPFTKDTYMAAVERMRQFIKTGDIYIANMTHTFIGSSEEGGYDIYRRLRYLNPAPFGAYLPLDGFEIMSSSPERFMQVRNGKAVTRPIKGTRPRSDDPEEDQRQITLLEESEKDKSELLMVVDLERNDLSKVCRPYTVKVTELFAVESYATVHHLVSTVEGMLREDVDAVDCMKACFPGGSITGTPKIRAMEVIEALEANRRNIYTGCIGYFGFDGNCDFNIVIRTLLKKDDKVFLGVGGGITWESDPEAEYIETLDKAKAMFRTLGTREV